MLTLHGRRDRQEATDSTRNAGSPGIHLFGGVAPKKTPQKITPRRCHCYCTPECSSASTKVTALWWPVVASGGQWWPVVGGVSCMTRLALFPGLVLYLGTLASSACIPYTQPGGLVLRPLPPTMRLKTFKKKTPNTPGASCQASEYIQHGL